MSEKVFIMNKMTTITFHSFNLIDFFPKVTKEGLLAPCSVNNLETCINNSDIR